MRIGQISAGGWKEELVSDSGRRQARLAPAEYPVFATDYSAGSKRPLLIIGHFAFNSVGVIRQLSRFHDAPYVYTFVQQRDVYGCHASP